MVYLMLLVAAILILGGELPSDLHGISRVNPLIIGLITHLLSGMSHQV